MVSAIEEEALEAIERLRQCCESDMLVDQNFNIPIFNILWRRETGKGRNTMRTRRTRGNSVEWNIASANPTY